MAKWRKNEPLKKALAREAKTIAKGVGKGAVDDCNARAIRA